ncbi:hypothetical protein Csa_007755 [Cucumis sativus]|uniref:Uncharacterized protein n=1 Tax=Cucumis sativus TaxID=3659 RepID=A0A0A0KQU5_CUCSA|nr:hypothetical protein Csa_007755 [Cucumis sativus]
MRNNTSSESVPAFLCFSGFYFQARFLWVSRIFPCVRDRVLELHIAGVGPGEV